jgi:hypothetical protein
MLKAGEEGLQGGGYVDSFEQKWKKGGPFKVIVDKSVTARGDAKCFGLVNRWFFRRLISIRLSTIPSLYLCGLSSTVSLIRQVGRGFLMPSRPGCGVLIIIA